MNTARFLEAVHNRTYTDGVEPELLFFGYSDYFKADDGARRRWQAAVTRAHLGDAALTVAFRFFVAETDPQSGFYVSRCHSISEGGVVKIEGLVTGHEATIRTDGVIQVQIGPHLLAGTKPELDM